MPRFHQVEVVPTHFCGIISSLDKPDASAALIEPAKKQNVRYTEDAVKRKEKTLHALINFIPEDKVIMRIINEGQELNINESSPGQKTAAVLAFILNQGKHPLIIDQPEDDLDNSLILDLIVENIRRIKPERQIIIATHNPNIPVLGDAEGIIILERDQNGKVVFRDNKKTGCIEEKLIKKGICEIMEGGIVSFKKREGKYKYVEQ